MVAASHKCSLKPSFQRVCGHWRRGDFGMCVVRKIITGKKSLLQICFCYGTFCNQRELDQYDTLIVGGTTSLYALPASNLFLILVILFLTFR